MAINGVITDACRVAIPRGFVGVVAGLSYANVVSYFVYGEGGFQHSTVNDEVGDTGDGSSIMFEITLANVPVKRGSVSIVAGAVTGTDNGNGVISGFGVSGTIKYKTGVIKLTFDVAVTNGVDITVDYQYRSAILAPDASLEKTRAQLSPSDPANPSHLAWYKKSFSTSGSNSKIYTNSPSPRLRGNCFIDADEFIDDGRGETPVIYELGIFDSEDTMLAYATFTPIVKNGSTQINKIVNLIS